jgi:hypothetical protein
MYRPMDEADHVDDVIEVSGSGGGSGGGASGPLVAGGGAGGGRGANRVIARTKSGFAVRQGKTGVSVATKAIARKAVAARKKAAAKKGAKAGRRR